MGATLAGEAGAGSAGEVGSTTGVAGTVGKSDGGLAGVSGSAGAGGNAGNFGSTAGMGAAGAGGAAGAPGAAGASGVAGASGAAGAQGAAGAKGAAGSGAAASGASGGSGAAGSGGMPAVTGACAGKVHALGAGDTLIGNFENGSLTGWYDYNDMTAGATINHLAIVSPGANGTTKAAHLSGSGFAGFGAGMGVELPCWNSSAFQGVTFWAMGTAGTDNNIQLQVAIPATHAVADGGDCVSKCYDHPSKHVALTSTWTQYHVAFSQLTQAGFGTPATYGGIIMALNWVSLAGPTLDFQIDEVAFY